MSRATTCVFWHFERDIAVTVHGDDFIPTDNHEILQWVEGVFKEKFMITTDISGHDDGSKKQLKVC